MLEETFFLYPLERIVLGIALFMVIMAMVTSGEVREQKAMCQNICREAGRGEGNFFMTGITGDSCPTRERTDRVVVKERGDDDYCCAPVCCVCERR